MKKRYMIGITFVWLFVFSLVTHASTVGSGRKEVIPAVRMNEAKSGVAEVLKDEASLVSEKELLGYVGELEEYLKKEENINVDQVDQIGTLTLTEGVGKKRAKLFTGTKKLLGKGVKDNRVNLVLFYVADTIGERKATVLQENSYEIGASRLFSAEISLDRIGINYLLVQVESEGQTQAYQLYQIVVEDTKTKDKLESMTLQFIK